MSKLEKIARAKPPKGFYRALFPNDILIATTVKVLPYVAATRYSLPVYVSKVQAGFPSPADDYMDMPLDLNDYLIKRPSATFLVRATGESMIKAGIHDNDLLIVDRSLEPSDGKIVIAVIDGCLTVKRISIKNNKIWLFPENNKFPLIPVDPETGIHIWGVVAHIIHSV